MSQMNAIPERDQVSMEETWNLTDLYADDAAWQAEFEVAQTYVDKLSAYAGRLGESGATLLEYLELCQEADTLLNNLANYAYRKGDQDTRVAQYQAMEGKISSLAVEINGAIAFETPELLAKTIGEAARDARRRLRQVEYRTQAADHPVLWGADQSLYLKFYIFQVLDEQ